MTQAENSERENKGVVLEARQKAGRYQDKVKALPQEATQGRGQEHSGGAHGTSSGKGGVKTLAFWQHLG